MRKIIAIILAILGGLLILFISTMSLASESKIDQNLNLATLVATAVSQITIMPGVDINDLPFQDNIDIYQYDDPDSVVTMYVTVKNGNASDNSNYTWEEVNKFTKSFNMSLADGIIGRAEAIVQIGNEDGPQPGEVGYGEVVSNATIQIRGTSSSQSPQKSYKIELRDQGGEWRGQKTIALNKHVWDLSRVKNKLCFDLMKEIPNMVSLRTQFVHLYIKDETTVPPGEGFVDYGLFTQIEQPNRRYLRSRLLDGDGQFYKTTFFEFYRYPDQIHLVDDPLYDEDTFSTILEIKGNKDHSKLIQMLEDINNYNIPIERTFEKYFDLENYFTWLAFNILVGNIDTQSQNFYLYSPKNGEKWYFIPWDYDGSLDRQKRDYFQKFTYEDWEYGIANYWGSVLHNRVLRVTKYRDMLTAKIDELILFLTPERLENLLNIYLPVIEPFVTSMPDIYYLPGTMDDFNLQYSLIPLEIQSNYELYIESLEISMPFFLGTPQLMAGGILFDWDESYDFDAQDIAYEFSIAKDWEFQDVIYSASSKNITSIQLEILEPGLYFWRVTATNEDGKTQYSFDHYFDAEGHLRSGMKYMYITPEGEILEK